MNHVESLLPSRLELPVDEETGKYEGKQRPTSPFAIDQQDVVLTLPTEPALADP